ncbi:MAG: hypothetical protein ACOYKD_02175 [Anaerolineaceae bacterium]|jgi:hypothetical protein
MTKNKNLILLLGLFIFVAAGLMLTSSQTPLPVSAQIVYATPTPNMDGKIIFVVPAGYNCTQVMLLTNVNIAEIIKLNNLDENCTIQEGQELLIGQISEPDLTQTAQPTPTQDPAQLTPTATPHPGAARICVVLFNDMDGNGMRTDFESYLYGGMVSVNDRVGKVSLTGTTVAGDPMTQAVTPLCFNEVPEDTYSVSIAIPDDFNPTTVTNYTITVKAGEIATIDFGAQERIAVNPFTGEQSSGGKRSPVLAILGGLILLAGLGLGFYMWRQRKI